jgi:hypothetical protein
MSRPLRFLLCASAAALIFGSEPSAFLAPAQVTDVAAPLPKFRGTHRVGAFHRASVSPPYNGAIGAASRVGGKARYGSRVDATSAIGGIGGASDVGGPALTQWRFGREIGGVPDVGGPALNGGFGGIGGGPDVGGPALNGGLVSGPARVFPLEGTPALGAPQFGGAPGLGGPRLR